MELEEAIKKLKAQLDTKTEKGYYKPMAEEETRVVLNHLTKQEKMIELMLEYLNFYGVEDDICTAELSKNCNVNCKECIKQYFEKKADESEEQ